MGWSCFGHPRSMQIPKDQVMSMLKERGDQSKVDQADQELPDQVDTEKHGGLLEKFGLSPQDLIAKFTGGGAGGITDKLGL